jgi:predicted DNA-binding antitoxin AbrB/MazE fold protein
VVLQAIRSTTRAALVNVRAQVQIGVRRARIVDMHALKAHVRNGHVVVDEPAELPEGTEVEVNVTKIVDPFVGMAPEERAELEQELEEGRRDFENGDHANAREFVTQLLAKP